MKAVGLVFNFFFLGGGEERETHNSFPETTKENVPKELKTVRIVNFSS